MQRPLTFTRAYHNPGPFLTTAVTNLVLLTLLGICAWLREDPLFWRNVGGWPLWLRDLVAVLFYPLFLLELGFLFTLTLVAIRCIALRCAYQGLALLALMLLWGLWLVIVSVVVVNNLENLLAGRPLHWHPL